MEVAKSRLKIHERRSMKLCMKSAITTQNHFARFSVVLQECRQLIINRSITGEVDFCYEAGTHARVVLW